LPTLLDTHAWVWWVSGDRRLATSARRAIDRDQARDALALSMISIWEVAKKVEKGQLVLDRPVVDWIDQATAQRGLHLVELTSSILVESCQLPQPFHGDPVDQLIVATARARDLVVLTKDESIRRYSHVRSAW
jgi:PIN domain nuclease of toxin-antitoxin system